MAEKTTIPSGTSTTPEKKTKKKSGRGAAATAGLVVGAILTVLLAIFIVQNSDDITPHFLSFTLPTLATGVYLLVAAAVGIAITLLLAGTRKVAKKL